MTSKDHAKSQEQSSQKKRTPNPEADGRSQEFEQLAYPDVAFWKTGTSPHNLRPRQLLRLQRTVGNRIVRRMLNSSEAGLGADSQYTRLASSDHHLAQRSFYSNVHEAIGQRASLQLFPGEGEPYTVTDYGQDLRILLQRLVGNTRTAAMSVKNTLTTQTFDTGNVVSTIASKGIGVALGFVPAVGPVLSGLWDIGTSVYGGAAAAAQSQSVNSFFQRVIDNADTYQTEQEAEITRKSEQYQARLRGLTGEAQQSQMDTAHRINLEGLSRCPSARAIERGMYEAFMQGRSRGSWFEEAIGVETRGRVELTYTGTFASPPYSLESASIKGSGNDGPVADRLNTLHGGRVNINNLRFPKRIRAPNNTGGSTYMDLNANNRITRDSAMARHFCWERTMRESFPTTRLTG